MTTKLQEVDAAALAERLEQVNERIAQACQRADRTREEVTLVAVSKMFPLAVIDAARELGLERFGENRARELRDKAEQRPGDIEGGPVYWHMVGHCQRNKAKFVTRHADAFDALDSPRLAEELDKRARKNDRVLPCLVQVNISGQEQKYGLAPEETHDFLDRLSTFEHLRVRGLMGMATYADDPETVRPEFQTLRRLFETYDASGHPTVEMQQLSMGMSGDFEVAIEEGATHVRIGSALFGPRPT